LQKVVNIVLLKIYIQTELGRSDYDKNISITITHIYLIDLDLTKFLTSLDLHNNFKFKAKIYINLKFNFKIKIFVYANITLIFGDRAKNVTFRVCQNMITNGDNGLRIVFLKNILWN